MLSANFLLPDGQQPALRPCYGALFSVLVCFLMLASPVTGVAADQPADKRPNILLLLADDWSWPHAGAYGDKIVKTPTFDRVANEGMLFTNAYCMAPSCTPARAALLTGQASHRLEESGNLHSILRVKFKCYPDLLEEAGYHVGLTRKGWGPGTLKNSGRTRNPAGPSYENFSAFLKSVPKGKPFCFWLGHRDPHRPYVKGSGVKAGLDPKAVVVPPYLADTPETREDICDYYFAVQRFDRDCGKVLDELKGAGVLDNTLVVISGDNGWPFPRGKCNLYDAGTRVPLAIRWPTGGVKKGSIAEEFISFEDFAPTFLEAAGLKSGKDMTGRSFLDLLKTGKSAVPRDRVFVERERHANVRKGNLGYPARAIRTRDYLYIRNFHPERWPAGDPAPWKAPRPYGDIDDGGAKTAVLKGEKDPKFARAFELACGKRPAEELYDLLKDPHQINNVAGKPEYAEMQKKLKRDLEDWMKKTGDPRAEGKEPWDSYPYHGKEATRPKGK